MENIDLTDERAIDLFGNLQCASRALHLAVTGTLARHQLRPSEFEVLRLLAASPAGTLRVGDLVSPATTRFSGMSRLVDRLLREQLVTREHGADDRRVQQVTITAAGRDRLRQARAAHGTAVNQVLRVAGLGAGATETLTTLLAHLGRAVDEA